jgi:hypothetical protein
VPTGTDGIVNVEVAKFAREDENYRPEAYFAPGPVETMYQSGRNAVERADDNLRNMSARALEKVASAAETIATGMQTVGVVYAAASGNESAMGLAAGLVRGSLRRFQGDRNLKQYKQVTGQVKNVVERREKKESKKMASLLGQSLCTISSEDGKMFDVDLDDADDEDEDEKEWEVYDYDDEN